MAKTPLIYSVSHFNLGLGALFGRAKPINPPLATGLYPTTTGPCLELGKLVTP